MSLPLDSKKLPPDKQKFRPVGVRSQPKCSAVPTPVRRTGAVAESAAVIISAVSHAVVNMTAGYGTVFQRTQSKTSACTISAFMVISTVDHTVMQMTASRGTPINCTDRDHGLLGLCTPPVTAALSMVASMSISGYGQQADGHDAQHADKKSPLDPHSKRSPFKNKFDNPIIPYFIAVCNTNMQR